ncbi:MAG: sulfatase [Planctomycetales bacterium]|nr:sulfatase [Planctomycetales bacterium]
MSTLVLGVVVCPLLALLVAAMANADVVKRPNILLAISDDQSFPHAGAYGDRAAVTPHFDRLAKQGVLFWRAYAGSPGCSPSRAALLTGRHHWQVEHAGTHGSSFSARFATYPDLLEAAGYFVGHTGKGWGPGVPGPGRESNPAGPAFNKLRLKPPHSGFRNTDYAANFADFLSQRPEGAPFCFWYGGSEPHRGFTAGSGLKDGGDPDKVSVPGYLPDVPEVRSDLLDYAREVQHFDEHLGRMVKLLEERGELDNTLIIVTSDNGMAFPRAKANCYEHGVHVPLAISWPQQVGGGREIRDLVGFVDLAPTILAAAGLPGLASRSNMSGSSLLDLLTSDRTGLVDAQRRAYAGRERHSSSRYNNSAYPQRCMRSDRWLLVHNFRPTRWPAGTPWKFEGSRAGPPHGGYHDIDACPTLSLLVERRSDPDFRRFLELAVAKRPEFELFDVEADPDCLENLASHPEHRSLLARLQSELHEYLRRTGDPRALDGGEVFETYARLSGSIRRFPSAREEAERTAP